jgi:hypothetical protein
MIPDFIDNVCEAKHLICDPFPINFCCTTKFIPVCGDRDVASYSIKFQEVFKALSSIKAYLACLSGTLPLGPLVPPSTPTAIPDEHPKRASEAAPCPLQLCYFDKWDIFADTSDCQYAMGFPVCIFNNLLPIFPISCHLLMSK